MTAEAFVDDTDATWIDPLRGRRGLKLPEAATACLPLEQTACLQMVADLADEYPLPVANPKPSPPEPTRLGDLVSDSAAPALPPPTPLALVDDLPDIHTVCAYDEPVRPDAAPDGDAARAGSPRPSPLPALVDARPPSSPWVADEGPRDGLPALLPELSSPSLPARVTPVSDAVLDAAAALASPVVAPEPSQVSPVPAADTAPMRPAKPRGPFDVSHATGRADTTLRPAHEYDDLPAPVRPVGAPRALPPNVPTWASCRTQMEGPGLWMEEESPAVRVHDPEPRAPSQASLPAHPAHARVPSMATPQRYVQTTINPIPSDAQVPVAARSRWQETLPFALVLVAITLATAAAVGAYL